MRLIAPTVISPFVQAVAVACLLSGAQLAWADIGAPFVLEAAPSGMARLYIFRSGVSDYMVRESPTLQLNGKQIIQLATESYTSIALAPGIYTLALHASDFGSRSWNSAVGFNIRPNSFYFLSVFKEYEPTGAIRQASPAPAPVQMIANPGQFVRVAGVTYEFIEQLDAVKQLPNLKYLRPGDPMPYVAR